MTPTQTDLTIFRIYEPHELKDGRYPYAWFDLGDGRGIKDIVREEAGHRCIRCQHPFRVGETGTYERERQPNTFVSSPAGISFDGLPEAQAEATHGRGVHWSPCDEHCTHRGPLRYRQGEGWDWDVIDGPDAEEDWIGVAGEGIRVGHDVEAAWRILTVHHLNERKFDCRWHNLVSLCQRCHLTIQRKVEMNQVWPYEHADWFKPYAAGFYAYSYRGVELTRAEVEKDLDELLALERVA